MAALAHRWATHCTLPHVCYVGTMFAEATQGRRAGHGGDRVPTAQRPGGRVLVGWTGRTDCIRSGDGSGALPIGRNRACTIRPLETPDGREHAGGWVQAVSGATAAVHG